MVIENYLFIIYKSQFFRFLIYKIGVASDSKCENIK